ncbi:MULTISPECIES: aminotransferase [Edaphosphingomonas]|uniref:aspartate transaminase n=2 Tax=Edaphosphingomonas TaxID=3423724 RepID=A0A2T4I6I1_9SPHN|nr:MULTISPECIES: aminotransferase [Sphingomonas]OHT20735.1 Methionine aminotransferase [Sphingomonas haloaromaticamans]PTD26229.1 pyridoxal phosphate-dependent aminotransferase [Sphingomonas fennica]
MNPIYAEMPTTIFEAMSALARELGAINLGQGFPDARGPESVIEAAVTALREGSNQYPPMPGLPELRRAVADHYRRHQDIDLDWTSEVTITSGATEALAAAILALVRPGDEVLLIQPMYDAYLPLVLRAGGVPRFARLAPPDWRIDAAMLDAAFTPATRLVILNNPVNPSASLFDAASLALLAERAVAHDAVVISDEVWEHLVFDGRRHLPIMALPGMRDRTVKIGSAGKIFSLTGWKVGWMCASPALSRVLAKAHQFLTFTTPPNLQAAAAHGLALPDDYFHEMRAGYARSRDRLAAGLADAGYRVLPSAGTYFLSVDLPGSGIAADDVTFAEIAVREAGVATIPVSAFYAEDAVRGVVRLCFAKQDETIDAGIARMAIARGLFES